MADLRYGPSQLSGPEPSISMARATGLDASKVAQNAGSDDRRQWRTCLHRRRSGRSRPQHIGRAPNAGSVRRSPTFCTTGTVILSPERSEVQLATSRTDGSCLEDQMLSGPLRAGCARRCLLGSMGSIGDAYDSSMTESFFGKLQVSSWTASAGPPGVISPWRSSSTSRPSTTRPTGIPLVRQSDSWIRLWPAGRVTICLRTRR
jgi:hypothetical protein